jgi:hypothetical protein
MYELHNMLNDLDQQHVFIDVINLMGSNHNLWSCWWHFDHCINMAIRLKMEAETQQITTKNLFRRLQLIQIDEKLWLIIVTEWGWILQQMKNNSDPLVRELSKAVEPESKPESEPVPPLEFIYYQQSWLTSPAALVTTFNSKESLTTAPSSPEHPAPPTDEPPLLPIPPPTTLQVPPYDYHHGRPRHYWHHPTYVVRSSSEESDGSPRSSALSLYITNRQWAQRTPYDQEGHALWEIWVGTPFVGHPSTSDLESPN